MNAVAPVPSPALPPHAHRRTIAGLVLAVVVTGLDVNIVNTALPSIATDLGGARDMSWIVTSFMLAQAAVTPVYGKLSDAHGRRMPFLIAIALFALASLCCGAARTVPQLAIFRAFQGLGAGGMVVLCSIVIADLAPPRERGRYQAMLMSAFAVSSLVGPLVGGLLTQTVGWRWVFYINPPVGALLFAMLRRVLPDRHGAPRRVDYAGAALMVATAAATLLSLTFVAGGNPRALTTALAAVAFGIGFALVERRAADPVLARRLLAHPVVRQCLMISALVAFPFFGSVVFLPLYLQLVDGFAPALSGLAIAPQVVGLVASSWLSGRHVAAGGAYGVNAAIGVLLIAIGLLLIGACAHFGSPFVMLEAALLVLGLGGGMMRPNLIVAIQHGVDDADIGIATAMLGFVHTLSGAAGVTMAGALIAVQVRWSLDGVIAGDTIARVLDEPARLSLLLAAPAAGRARQAYADAIATIFLASGLIATLSLVLAVFLARLIARRDAVMTPCTT